jgi:hypothetical protein
VLAFAPAVLSPVRFSREFRRAFGEMPVTCQNSVRAPGTRRDMGRTAVPRCLARVLKRLVRGFVRPTLTLPVSSVLQSRFGQALYSAGRYSSRPVLLRATRVRRGTRVGAFASSFARSPVDPPLSGVSELTVLDLIAVHGPRRADAAPSAGTRAARQESLTGVPGRIRGVAVWWKCDTLPVAPNSASGAPACKADTDALISMSCNRSSTAPPCT